MSALDQAFIKAYMQQGETSAEAPLDPAKPVSLNDTLDEQFDRKSDSMPTEALVEGMMEMLQQPSDRLDPQEPASAMDEDAKDDEPSAAQTTDTTGQTVPSFVCTGSRRPDEDDAQLAPTLDTLGLAGVVHRLDPETSTEPTARGADQTVPPPHLDTATGGDAPEIEISTAVHALQRASLPADTDVPDRAVVTADDAKGGEPFRPMLQVDHFIWPNVCQRLGNTAVDELGRLTDALVAAMTRGQKVLALSGCRRGEGATTLLLCAGQHLAKQGYRVVLVDANWQDPKLAKQLGLLPEFGWEEVLAGRVSLEEVVIETLDNRLAVLPVRGSLPDAEEHSCGSQRMARSIQTLRGSYDLVLVDLGSPKDPKSLDNWPARPVAGVLDAVVLVHNVRATTQNRLVEFQRALATADVAQVGIVQNFVRD